ncbi:MAG: hypothetical protein PVSMB1_05020 [Gemmatimonadaceae bacterium]
MAAQNRHEWSVLRHVVDAITSQLKVDATSDDTQFSLDDMLSVTADKLTALRQRLLMSKPLIR